MQARLSQRTRHIGVSGAFALFLISCVFVLSACGGGSNPPASTASKKGGNLSVGLVAEPTTLDPEKSVSLYDSDIMTNMYDPLFKYDLQGKIQPYLVSSFNYPTPTQLDLTLRTGVKFHDGTPFNADAVLFNINRFINDKTGPRYTDVADIDTLVKVSDSQVQIKLKKPFAPLLNVLTGDVGLMLSPAVVQSLGPTKLANAPVNAGSGPFIFAEWVKSDHLLLKANPNYWQKDKDGIQLPYLQSIRWRTITNRSVMFNNLETNQIQVASNIDPNNVAQIKSDPNLVYKQTVTPGFASMQLNTSVAPLNNLHVRRAIAWAINRQDIVHTIFKDVAVAAKGPFSSASWAYDQNYAGITYDPAKAKDELAQSGLSNVSFQALSTSGDPTTDQEVQLIQSQLKAVGITMTIKAEVFTTLVQDFQSFKYQAVLIGWTGSLDPDGVVYQMFYSKGGVNYTKYANPQVDQLLDQGRIELDQAKRAQLYQQAQQLIVDDASRVFINHQVVTQATSNKVQNYALYPSQVLDFTSVYLQP